MPIALLSLVCRVSPRVCHARMSRETTTPTTPMICATLDIMSHTFLCLFNSTFAFFGMALSAGGGGGWPGDPRGMTFRAGSDTPGDLGSNTSDHDQGSIGVSITSPKVSADAPGPDGTASRLADGTARLLPAAVHRPVVPHLLRPGRRVPRPDGPADGVRDADRRRAVGGVAA